MAPAPPDRDTCKPSASSHATAHSSGCSACCRLHDAGWQKRRGGRESSADRIRLQACYGVRGNPPSGT
eukprot:3299788-Pleurochrysis_carterae.AAC.1